MGSLDSLARLSPEQIGGLRDIVDSTRPSTRYAMYVKIAEAIGVTDQEAGNLFSFWEYIQDERRDNAKSEQDTLNELVAFLKTRSRIEGPDGERAIRISKLVTEKRIPLTKLFADLPNRDLADKRHALECGPLPHLSSFRSFCDLRPIYDGAGTKIVDFVPTITIRVRTHSETDEYKEMFVQLTERQVETLESEVQRLRRKLAGLRERFAELLPERKKKGRTKGA